MFKGLGKGAVGLLVKPLAGVADAAASISGSLADNFPDWFEKKVFDGDSRRCLSLSVRVVIVCEAARVMSSK